MLALIIIRESRAIKYQIYKLYQKRTSLQLSAKIIPDKLTATYRWEVFNSQGKLLSQTNLDLSGSPALDQLQHVDLLQIIQHPNLSLHTFDLITVKIAHGGSEYFAINLLNEQNLQNLAKYEQLAPNEQTQDLALAKELLNYFPQARHYACFDSGFHQTIPAAKQMLLADPDYLNRQIRNYGNHGLIFNALKLKISTLCDKKITKGKWVLVYLTEQESSICAIKNGKSLNCSGSGLHQDLPSATRGGKIDPALIKVVATNGKIELDRAYQLLNEQGVLNPVADKLTINSIAELVKSPVAAAQLLSDFYCSQIAGLISQFGNQLQGIDGIIFSGSLAEGSPRLRQLICNQLAWLGINLSNKANIDNKCKLSKKNSTSLVFSVRAEPELAMLEHLLERI